MQETELGGAGLAPALGVSVPHGLLRIVTL
jgi:hypothetical protein